VSLDRSRNTNGDLNGDLTLGARKTKHTEVHYKVSELLPESHGMLARHQYAGLWHAHANMKRESMKTRFGVLRHWMR
jgi:hypothetical protein